MPTYKLTIEYEGTRYSGWQAQGNTQKTIQGHLLRAASEVVGETEIGGAGRTDAGVHAVAQVAHLRCRRKVDPTALMRGINDRLPHDIAVLSVTHAANGFHARHDALMRFYLFQIATRRTAFAKPFVWWIKDTLDVPSMETAARLLGGRHDFSAFADKRLKQDESRIVVVESCAMAVDGDLVLFRIGASHFLWRMVRKLVSFLVEVGRGNAKPEDLSAMLQNRGPAWAPTAPPSGLFLEAVTYEGERFERPLRAIIPVSTFLPARSRR
jgi:tRNA pseudouridine38-40 synthase